MNEVEKLSAWIPVTSAMIADAMPLNAMIEYHLAGSRPLTLRERLTGWRSFTARSGYTIRMRVGWRASVYWLVHPIENWRRHHPSREDDECE